MEQTTNSARYEIVMLDDYGYWTNDLGDNTPLTKEEASETIEGLRDVGYATSIFSIRPIDFECTGHSGDCAPSCWDGEVYNPTCECNCGCDDDDSDNYSDDCGTVVCDTCTTYFDDDGEMVCSRMTDDFTKCHVCDAKIEWSGILTGQPGTANHRIGGCKCGDKAWGERELGNWGNYGYEADEDEIEMRKIVNDIIAESQEPGAFHGSLSIYEDQSEAIARLLDLRDEVCDNWTGYAKDKLQFYWQTWLSLRPMDKEDPDDMAEWNWDLHGHNPADLYIVVDEGGQNRYIASKTEVDAAWEEALTYEQFHELHSAVDVC